VVGVDGYFLPDGGDMKTTIDMAETISHGWWLDDEKLKAFEALVRADERNQQPAVPDAMRIANKESPDYREGWNDCRALMLEMRKP
jgi:hypothetical protein